MAPNEFIGRMSRDPRLDAFNAKNKQHLFREFLWALMDEAHEDVMKDLKTPTTENDITLSKDTRAINLPDDYIQMLQRPRYKDSLSDPLAEGFETHIVNVHDLL